MFLKTYDDELYCACYANDSLWVYSGETCKLSIHTWVTDAQVAATDAFRLEVAYENFTCDVDVVPVSSSDVVRKVNTGVCLINQSFCAHPPIDMAGVAGDDSLTFRLRRIAAADEIAGEVVIQHVGVIFKCDKLGSEEP